MREPNERDVYLHVDVTDTDLAALAFVIRMLEGAGLCLVIPGKGRPAKVREELEMEHDVIVAARFG